ncbi:hypothetical protein KADA111694_09965 [Kaistella daneshvariae]
MLMQISLPKLQLQLNKDFHLLNKKRFRINFLNLFICRYMGKIFRFGYLILNLMYVMVFPFASKSVS